MLDPRARQRLERKKLQLDALRPLPPAALERLIAQITVILRANRVQYYRVLAQADLGQVRPLANYVGRAVERNLTLYLQACTPRTRPPAARDRWISLREAAEGTPYSQEYLSLLARIGRLEAVKRGRLWYTTRKAVAEYRRSVAAGASGHR